MGVGRGDYSSPREEGVFGGAFHRLPGTVHRTNWEEVPAHLSLLPLLSQDIFLVQKGQMASVLVRFIICHRNFHWLTKEMQSLITDLLNVQLNCVQPGVSALRDLGCHLAGLLGVLACPSLRESSLEGRAIRFAAVSVGSRDALSKGRISPARKYVLTFSCPIYP